MQLWGSATDEGRPRRSAAPNSEHAGQRVRGRESQRPTGYSAGRMSAAS